MLAVRDPAYLATIQSAEWNVVDGSGIAAGIRLRALTHRGRRLPREDLRRPGADLIWDLASACSTAERALLVVGGQPDRLSKALARLRFALPSLVVEGIAPHFGQSPVPDEQREIEALIDGLRPAVVVACLGAPKQERWIEASFDALHRGDVRIAAGLGGTVDFLSGDVPRAPEFVRRVGFEWLYRLYVEPYRWRRQARALPAFALRAVLQRDFIHVSHREGG
ncbi:WecB/TagA/CpsF family glycosyltransferase [Anaeromyxobacter dehalogenans]